MPSQLSQSEDFTLHYFGIKGAAGLATIVLEQAGLDYTPKAYQFEQWLEFKPKTPTGLLPVIEYKDGAMTAESMAIARVCAAKANLLGEGRDFGRSETLIGMCADVWKLVGGNCPTVMTIASWTPEQTAAWQNEFKPKIKASMERFTNVLLPAKDKFTEKGDLLGELELWYRMYQLLNGGYPELLGEIPGLKAFYDRVGALAGPTKLHENKTKWGELPNYLVPLPA